MKATRYFSLVPLLCPTLMLAALSPAALAEQIEQQPQTNEATHYADELVVTGELQTRKLSEVTSSVTLLSAEQIDARNAQHLDEILNSVANVNFSAGASRGRFFQIRGIGERSQFVSPVNPSVGVMLDDLNISQLGLSADMFDLQQVEILRGPQGTSAGANGLAGLIKLVSANGDAPSHLRYGRSGFNGDQMAGAAGWESDDETAMIRVSYNHQRSDGYTKNTYLNRDDTNNRDEQFARIKTQWQLHPDHLLAVNLYNNKVNNGYDAFTLDNSRNSIADQPGVDTLDSTAATAKWTTQWNQLQLHAIATTVDADSDYGYDEDWTNPEFALEHNGYAATDLYQRARQQNSIELRLNNDSNHELPFVVGVYQSRQSETLSRTYTYAGPFSSRFDTVTQALFGEVEMPFGQQWSVSTGARFERRQADYKDTASSEFSPVDTMAGGHVALQYRLEHGQTYARLSQGYKAGGFNLDGSLPTDLREYKPEALTAIELGYKGQLQQHFVQAAMFYSQRQDQQIKTWLSNLNEDGSTEFIDLRTNAAEGRNIGIELSMDSQWNDYWSTFYSLGLLDTEYGRHIVKVDDQLIDIGDREQAHAPNWQFNAGVQLQLGALTVRAEIEGKDAFYFSDTHNERSDSMTVGHLSASYRHQQWQLNVYGRNLTNEEYSVRGFGFGNDPRTGYTSNKYVQFGEPRIIGVQLSYQFND